MADIDTTAAAVFIPEVWSGKMIVARTATYWMLDRVWRWDEDVADYGDTIHVPRISNFTAKAVAADGSVSPQATTETEVSITLSNWYEVTFRITDRVIRQAKHNLIKAYTDKAGKALAQQIETDLLALWSGATTNLLTAQATFDEDFVLSAVEKLDLANVPEEDRFGILYPTQKTALLKIDKYSSDQYRAGAGEQITKYRFTKDLHGVEFSTSTLVPTSGGERKNMIWQREGIACAVQKKVNFEELAKDGKRRTFSADEIYGVGESRDDHITVAPTTT